MTKLARGIIKLTLLTVNNYYRKSQIENLLCILQELS